MAGGRDRRYLAIVERIAREIESGTLAAGARLPTHREFARELGVSVQTVTRAYAEAQRRGLVSGQVGRGTFVLGHTAPRRAEDVSTLGWTSFGAGAVIDLAFNGPVLDEAHTRAVALHLGKLQRSAKLDELIAYQPPWLGLERHRKAGAAWLLARGLKAKADDIVVISGAQHGAATVLSALTEPGDTVMTEALTDPGIKFIAASRRLNLKGIAIDDQGLIPDALDEACRAAR
ncbi:MAG: GntR family transcriptional regulator, partial [Alphaproteobacteria bacterium]